MSTVEILQIIVWSVMTVVWILMLYAWIQRIKNQLKHGEQLERALSVLLDVVISQHTKLMELTDAILDGCTEEEDDKNPCMGVNPPDLPVKGEEEG